MDRIVMRVDRSPMNLLNWYLELACGHDVVVTTKTKPSRKKQWCAKCAVAAKERV